MNKNRFFQKYKNIIFTVIGIGLVFLIWWILSLIVSYNLFPNPGETFISFGELFITVRLWEAIGSSLLRLLIALLICFIFSMVLGIFSGLIDPLYRILKPLVITLRTLPVAAIMFALIVFLKPNYSLFIISNLMMFPLMYEAIVSAVRNIDQGIYDSIKLDNSLVHPRSITKVIIPSAKEGIILGIVQSMGLGMKVMIMAEALIGSNATKGIGNLIYNYYIDLQMSYVFALALYAIILIGIMDIIVNIIKKKINN